MFLDMEAVAGAARDASVAVEPARLREAEGVAKRRYEALLAEGASHEDGWGLYMQALLVAAGVAPSAAAAAVPALRAEHDRLNLWRAVPRGLAAALGRARAMGLSVAVVSNSEGRLDALFRHLDLEGSVDLIVDSALEGVRKPDPEIFRRALSRLGVTPERALHAGDLPAVDVGGARAAGLHAALIDPLGFYADHAGPRYSSVEELVDAIQASGGRAPRGC